jgi:hypothetical protein
VPSVSAFFCKDHIHSFAESNTFPENTRHMWAWRMTFTSPSNASQHFFVIAEDPEV